MDNIEDILNEIIRLGKKLAKKSLRSRMKAMASSEAMVWSVRVEMKWKP